MEQEQKPIPFDELVSQNLEDTSFLNRKMRQKLTKFISKFIIIGGFTLTSLIILINFFAPQNSVVFKTPTPIAKVLTRSIDIDLYKVKDKNIHINYLQSPSDTLTSILFFDNTIILNTYLSKEQITNLPSFAEFIRSPDKESFNNLSKDIYTLENKLRLLKGINN